MAYGGRAGGHARVQDVLTLGRYKTNNNGVFFTMSSSTQVSTVATPVEGSG